MERPTTRLASDRRHDLKASMKHMLGKRSRGGSSMLSALESSETSAKVLFPADLWTPVCSFLDVISAASFGLACEITQAAQALGPEETDFSELTGHQAKCLLHSGFGQRWLSRVRKLKLADVQRDQTRLRRVVSDAMLLRVPPLPLLEELQLEWCTERVAIEECTKLRQFLFDWNGGANQLKSFSLHAGNDLSEFLRPEIDNDMDMFHVVLPGVKSLDLSGLSGYVHDLGVNCPQEDIHIAWPERHIVRRVTKLNVNLAGDPTGLLQLSKFTGLRALSIVTSAARLDLPEALHICSLDIEATALRRLDLSEWTAFGELESLALRKCAHLSDMKLPMGGKLSNLHLEIGDNIKVMKIHLKEVQAFELRAPSMHTLHLVTNRGLSSEKLKHALSGCPSLQFLSLEQSADLEVLDIASCGAPKLIELDMRRLSRAHRLSSVLVEAAYLKTLVMPQLPLGDRPYLRRIVLTCPQLTKLDLSMCRWLHLEEIRIEAQIMDTLLLPEHRTPLDLEDQKAKPQIVQVVSARLSVLDLRGATALSNLVVSLQSPIARLQWPRSHDGRAIEMQLNMPHSNDPFASGSSAVDGSIVSLDLSGCQFMDPALILTMKHRWSNLKVLDAVTQKHVRMAEVQLAAMTEKITSKEHSTSTGADADVSCAASPVLKDKFDAAATSEAACSIAQKLDSSNVSQAAHPESSQADDNVDQRQTPCASSTVALVVATVACALGILSVVYKR